jgi:succinate dehydrogenase / fumarate reductase flavoprotein subunit
MFDTVKGGDYLPDQDAVEILCQEAIDAVYDLERMGLPFDRAPDGRIEQRVRAGGHTRNFGEAPVARTCFAADRTGQMVLYTLYQQCLRREIVFFDEFQVVDLLMEQGRCIGVVAWDLRWGGLHAFYARAVLIATGGWGQLYRVTTNATSLTGDGPAMVWRHGLPLEDMEFYQFHPTGIYKRGILLSEASRGEGVYLVNGAGERFMERYAPTMKELAPRDMVSRAIYQEIREGRGGGAERDCVFLDFRHLSREVLKTRLPEVVELARVYLGLDPAHDLVPVQPTAHYAIGGIPTDVWGRVLSDEHGHVIPGLYAAGECACVSVHGANRLGTNSLVDILVFGRRAGRDMAQYIRQADMVLAVRDLPPGVQMIQELLQRRGSESIGMLRRELQNLMMEHVSVFRNELGLREALSRIYDLQDRYQHVQLGDRGKIFNQALMEAWELGCLLDVAEATTISALYRTESRGTHYREDFPMRDDHNWLKHTLVYRVGKGKHEIRYKPVVVTRFPPKERVY